MAKFVRKKNPTDNLLALKSDYDALIRLAFRNINDETLSHTDKVNLIRDEYRKLAPDVERNELFLERLTKLKLEIQNRPKNKLKKYFTDVASLFQEGDVISQADFEELIEFEKKEEKVMPSDVNTVSEIPQPKLIKVEGYQFYKKDSKKSKKEELKQSEEEKKQEERNNQEVSTQLAKFVSQEIETEETIKKKIEVVKIIDQIFRKVDWAKHHPDLEVTYAMYGSYVNQFSTRSSDIDITLNTNINTIEDKLLLTFFLGQIKPDLNRHQCDHKLLADARVPLLEVEFLRHKVAVSFSVNNKLGAINSKMLELYTSLDERCQMLGLLVKIWASKHGILSAKKGYLSSYAYSLMVINFLQTVKPPVLPSLQQLRANDPNPVKISFKGYPPQGRYETRVDYEDNLERLHKIMAERYSRNTMSVIELLRRFFRFYMNKKAVENIVISIREGKHLERNVFSETSKYLYSIEDPFDLYHNPGKYVLKTSDQAAFILDAMEDSYRLLKKKRVMDIFES